MKRSKRPVNVVMSEETKEKAARLQVADTRPSLSNLVESLIVREHARVFPNTPATDPSVETATVTA